MAQRESKLGQCTRNKLIKKPFLLLKENANSKAVQKMDTHQTESSLKENSFHMVATSSTLVMHRTLWMAPTFCTATMAFGTLAFPRIYYHGIICYIFQSLVNPFHYYLMEKSITMVSVMGPWSLSPVIQDSSPKGPCRSSASMGYGMKVHRVA